MKFKVMRYVFNTFSIEINRFCTREEAEDYVKRQNNPSSFSIIEVSPEGDNLQWN